MRTAGELSRNKKIGFGLATAVIATVALVVLSELMLRVVGIEPWTNPPKQTRVEPGGRLFQTNPTLGYTHIPGAYTVILADGYTFHITNMPNTLRVTHPMAAYDGAINKDEIWIFGCSFTYGWAIEDDQTYSWLLQKDIPEYEVVNFGCSGYGTLHSLIQLREALAARPAPKAVVLAYASMHDGRNTFVRKRRKNVASWNSLGPLVQPYASLDGDGKLVVQMADVEYREFPLMQRSALAHFVEIVYNHVESVRTPSRRVTEAIIAEMVSLCREHGIPMVFAFIDGRPYMMDYVRTLGIPTVDMHVDMSVPKNTNTPHDGHPSALANRHYASVLEPALRQVLADPVVRQ